MRLRLHPDTQPHLRLPSGAHGHGHSHHHRHARHARPHPPHPAHGHGGAVQPAAAAAAAHPCMCASPEHSPLAILGLPDALVRNVVMSRDIVPRAFACDYALVTDILRGWGPAFKSHPGLMHPEHKHLYSFTGACRVKRRMKPAGGGTGAGLAAGAELPSCVADSACGGLGGLDWLVMVCAGRIMVLQPDSWHWFASIEPEHPMLPPGPDLYLLNDPAAAAGSSGRPAPRAPSEERATKGQRGGGGGAPAALVLSSSSAARRRAAGSVTEAVWALMDTPHPLDTLTDPGAYLEKGSISRYHNPGRRQAYARVHTKAGRCAGQARLTGGRRPVPAFPQRVSAQC